MSASTRVTVGVGACEDAPVDELYALVVGVLGEAGVPLGAVDALATVDVKADERAIVECARRLGVPVLSYGAELLAGVTVPNPSGRALSAVGTPSVAEAAALAALGVGALGVGPLDGGPLGVGAPGSGAELLVPKRKSSPEGRPAMATCAVACTGMGGTGDLFRP
ncbi:cobalamin biosynthesis protein [Streptomyces sp. NBC_00237]|uniref:cobalamin biosynthesis protein n=1 Tax=Streptomyces sp. NBC_00237 TaxID=2975687 RepID=UPI002B1D9F40|nr:cobalamin biosynthesis protein [Streptomyces sp. NBC_00237]